MENSSNHLFNAALAELEFAASFLLYLGKAKELVGKPFRAPERHVEKPLEEHISLTARSLKRPPRMRFEAYFGYVHI